jgi:hypothetical protein
MKKNYSLLLLFLSLLIFSQKKWNIKFYNEFENNEIRIFADNDEEMPISTKFNFKLKNMISSLLDEEIIVIPANTKKYLISTLNVLNPNKENSFSYTNTYNFGDATLQNYD